MTYAHREGYVTTCANRYFQHLTPEKRSFSYFERQFYINSFLVRLDALYQSRSNVEARCKLIDGGADRFAYVNPDLVDTRSDLSADVIKDICVICGVDGSHFQDKRIFIDRMILKR